MKVSLPAGFPRMICSICLIKKSICFAAKALILATLMAHFLSPGIRYRYEPVRSSTEPLLQRREVSQRLIKVLMAALFPLLLVFTLSVCATQQVYPTLDDVVAGCYDYLESHLCTGTKWGKFFHFYRPSLEKYSADQWLWDSGSHMIVWSHKNVSNSILDLRTMLHMQQPDGFIPEEIFWSHRTPKEELELLSQYSNTKYSDISQTPVLPYSLRAIVSAVEKESGIAKAKLITKEFLYPLVNYFKWWRNTRDLGDGLVVMIHNWEGLDASPAYDPAFHTYVTSFNESAFKSLYPKFLELTGTYRFLYGWNVTEILSRSKKPDYLPDVVDTWFVVKDIGLNSVYASGWRLLSELASFIGDVETATYCESESVKSSEAILSKMYSSEQGQFRSLYVDNDGIEKFSQANTIQNIFPLLLKDLSAEQLDLLLDQIKDANKFGGSLYALPTGTHYFTSSLTYSLTYLLALSCYR